ncbi:MAG TPA: hypothetical protein VFX59_02305 [Polyangiales bacterium]|nr:hypothetical protein [Polyangiales bacterium]
MNRSRNAVRLSLCLCAGLAAAACGGKPAKPESADKPAAEAASSYKSGWQPPELEPAPPNTPIALLGIKAPADKPWNDMSYSEKEWYMIGGVHPVMRQVFQTFNEKKFEGEKFECTPCHGEKPEERKYKMPSDHLSKVPAFGSADWKAMENSRIFKFMTLRVTPSMGKLLGEQEWNPETGEGYSCWGCHPKAD